MKLKGSLCKLEKKDVADNLEELIKIVGKPKFVCQRCARVSKKEDYLCRPLSIKEIVE